MRLRPLALFVGFVLASCLLLSTARAADSSRWRHYRDKAGHVLIVKTACIRAEDSAAHLRLITYDGGGRAVYGCKHSGY